MYKLYLSLCLIAATCSLQAQDKTAATVKPAQWSIITNPLLKGDNGLLVLNLPGPCGILFTASRVGEPKILVNLHSSGSKELPPGKYEITFWNIKIPVAIEKDKETRVFAGVLNSTVKKPWEVWTVTGEKVFAGGSAKMVALPIGKYIIKTSGTEIKTTINDGQVTIFSFTNY